MIKIGKIYKIDNERKRLTYIGNDSETVKTYIFNHDNVYNYDQFIKALNYYYEQSWYGGFCSDILRIGYISGKPNDYQMNTTYKNWEVIENEK